jgi:hypothetical protein
MDKMRRNGVYFLRSLTWLLLASAFTLSPGSVIAQDEFTSGVVTGVAAAHGPAMVDPGGAGVEDCLWDITVDASWISSYTQAGFASVTAVRVDPLCSGQALYTQESQDLYGCYGIGLSVGYHTVSKTFRKRWDCFSSPLEDGQGLTIMRVAGMVGPLTGGAQSFRLDGGWGFLKRPREAWRSDLSRVCTASWMPRSTPGARFDATVPEAASPGASCARAVHRSAPTTGSM